MATPATILAGLYTQMAQYQAQLAAMTTSANPTVSGSGLAQKEEHQAGIHQRIKETAEMIRWWEAKADGPYELDVRTF